MKREEEIKGVPVSYQIYITKSVKVARIMAEGLKHSDLGTRYGGEVFSVSYGNVGESSEIPGIHHNSDNFYAMVKYQNGETGYPQEYEIIFC